MIKTVYLTEREKKMIEEIVEKLQREVEKNKLSIKITESEVLRTAITYYYEHVVGDREKV